MKKNKREVVSATRVGEEWFEQQPYIDRMRQVNEDFFKKTGRKKKVLINTWGCQMNENDSEKMLGMLNNLAYEETDKKEEADLIIFNTCLIRENAELKVYGNIGALKPLKEKNPNLVIGICGCMMQKEHIRKKLLEKYKQVDLVFGTHNYHTLPQLIERVEDHNERIFDVWDDNKKVVENLPIHRKFEFKAFLDIMYGCNNFCTYCVVPYTRGREKSREVADIISEIKTLVSNGYKEITLLGQNVNSYGKNLENPITFSDLLDQIANIENLDRIRFMTSHPKDISVELLEIMAKHNNICNQLHLPIQSGSNKILKAMNRRYTREHYLEMVQKAKELMPDITLTTDLIVGFPGETEEDFEETLELVKTVEYDSAFMFLYSVREGTPAAEMENQVPDDIKHERFDRLVEIVNDLARKSNLKQIGREVEVLVEGLSKNREDILSGRTKTHKLIHFPGTEELIGQVVKVKINEAKSFNLSGELI